MRTKKLIEQIVTCKEAVAHPTRRTEKLFILNRNYEFEYRKIGKLWWYVIKDYKHHYSMKVRSQLGSYTGVGFPFEINIFLTHDQFERYFYHYHPDREKIIVRRPRQLVKN